MIIRAFEVIKHHNCRITAHVTQRADTAHGLHCLFTFHLCYCLLLFRRCYYYSMYSKLR